MRHPIYTPSYQHTAPAFVPSHAPGILRRPSPTRSSNSRPSSRSPPSSRPVPSSSRSSRRVKFRPSTNVDPPVAASHSSSRRRPRIRPEHPAHPHVASRRVKWADENPAPHRQRTTRTRRRTPHPFLANQPYAPHYPPHHPFAGPHPRQPRHHPAWIAQQQQDVYRQERKRADRRRRDRPSMEHPSYPRY